MRDNARFAPGTPCQNRILTGGAVSQAPINLPPIATPASDTASVRWSTYSTASVSQNNTNNSLHTNGADSANASRNASKEPSPAPVLAPKPTEPPKPAFHANGNGHAHQNGQHSTSSVVSHDETDSRNSPNIPAVRKFTNSFNTLMVWCLWHWCIASNSLISLFTLSM